MAEYIPGVCNIGPQETNRRKRLGWIGLAVSVFLFLVLSAFHVNHWLRILIFFPAMLSASGFLQAHFHFCAGFARKGVFNFGEIGKIHEVKDDSAKEKDKQQGNKISLYAALIGIAAALICVYI